MVKIKWTNHALEELDDIANYISKDSPKYAQILVKQIYEMVSHLKQYPKLGRKVPEYGDPKLREILYKTYRIIYLIKKEHLEIISIIQGSRKLNL
ncbi:MAG: type II toxin-antitoxin system RelE/ParE family toxin [Candidatus Lokiarchaeota archaeon]|nr:type II toxin-antitoxin system RelE/ParE family toxin [Candidatus Lokiarchaeota archaeon]